MVAGGNRGGPGVMNEIPARAPASVLAFNEQMERNCRELPPIWEAGAEEARRAREEGRSLLGPLTFSERAADMAFPAPDGPVRMRIIEPVGETRGVFMHIHGGGWTLGAPHHQDPLLEDLADSAGLTVASVLYRLAPEHPYPAGPDDCERAALWLARHAPQHLGGELAAIGGESAGAHLSVATCLRLRDRHGLAPFRAALLTYGVYDLRGSPSMRRFGDRPLILNTPITAWFIDQFMDSSRRDDPDASPLLADLAGMPPAIFTVGDADPLLDDTLFMDARWKAAGIPRQLDFWPGAVHGFDLFNHEYAASARARMHRFLNSALDETLEKSS